MKCDRCGARGYDDGVEPWHHGAYGYDDLCYGCWKALGSGSQTITDGGEPESILCRCCGTLLPGDVVHNPAVGATLDRQATVVCELCQSPGDDHVHP